MSADYCYRVHDAVTNTYLESSYRSHDKACQEARTLNAAELVLGGRGYRFAAVMTTPHISAQREVSNA